MDPDALRAALDRWTDEEVIDEPTAERIREFEAGREQSTPDGPPRETDPDGPRTDSDPIAAGTGHVDHAADDGLLGRG
ncbi:hypothetical protein, partial [Halorubrum tibetense]